MIPLRKLLLEAAKFTRPMWRMPVLGFGMISYLLIAFLYHDQANAKLNSFLDPFGTWIFISFISIAMGAGYWVGRTGRANGMRETQEREE